MNFQEASEHLMKVKWKAEPCFTGEECWCRVIVPEEKLKDDEGNEVDIANSGCVSKNHAEYIVKLHNDSLNKSIDINIVKNLGTTEFELNLSDTISRLYDLTLYTDGNTNKTINDAINLLESIK